MAIYDEMLELRWPDEFIVEYVDGTRERLLRADGVGVHSAADDPDGIGGIDAGLPPKHPRIRQQIGRYVRFRQLRAICSADGQQLWPRTG
jgi:hypothetical protein